MKFYFRCPKCGSDEEFVKPSEEKSDLGTNLLFIGGIMAASMYADHVRRRVQCGKCSYIFRQPPIPSATQAKFAGWILALTLIPVLVAVAFVSFEDLAALLPALPVIDTIEEAVTMQPRVAAYLIAVVVVLVGVTAWVAAVWSNFRLRRKYAAEFQTKPLPAKSEPVEPIEERSLQSPFENRPLSATED